MANLLDVFPGDASIDIDDNEQKHLLFNGMKEKYKSNWTVAGKKVDKESESEIVQYFEEQQCGDPDFGKKKDRNGNKKRKQNDNGNGDCYNHKGRNGGDCNRNKCYDNNKSTHKNIKPTDCCPLCKHNHTWEMCHRNTNGKNFKPRNRSNGGQRHNL